MFILISIIYNNIIITLLLLPPSPTSMGWTSNEDNEVQLRDINQVVTKAFFDD